MHCIVLLHALGFAFTVIRLDTSRLTVFRGRQKIKPKKANAINLEGRSDKQSASLQNRFYFISYDKSMNRVVVRLVDDMIRVARRVNQC